jgi:hypothetical protein
MNTISLTVVAVPNPSQNALAILAGHLGEDIYATNLRKDAESSRGTRSPNTERALLADVLLFSAWCSDAGRQHLPASAETVAAFVDAQASAGKAPASIRRYAASIAAYHRSAGAANPLDLKIATDALKRMARSPQREAAPGEGDQRQSRGADAERRQGHPRWLAQQGAADAGLYEHVPARRTGRAACRGSAG